MISENDEKDAAELPNNLIGKLLLAMPTMGDLRFHRSVIYICAHDKNGAMGWIVNHKLPGLEFEHLLEQMNLTSDINIDLKALSIPVMSGGPVDAGRGFLLHSNDFKQAETIMVDETFSVTGTIDALKAVAHGQGPSNMLFILGYAGWSAGQLDEELRQNSWLVADPDPAIIFSETNDDKWNMAIAKLGFDPSMLSAEAGRA